MICNFKNVVVLFMLCLLPLFALSQSAKDNIRFGEAAFNDGDYYSAAYYFSAAVKQEPDNIKLTYLLAEASLYSFAYREAEHWYGFVLKNASVEDFPLISFKLGSVKKSLGKYHEALVFFESFYNQNKNNDTSFNVLKAKQEIASCRFAISTINDTLNVKVSPLDKSINTPYSEFNPYILGDTVLYFSSLRPTAKERPNALIPVGYNTMIYKSSITLSGWSKAVEIDSRINTRDAHNANICFNNDNSVMYFSRCHEEKSNKMFCHLYKSKKDNNNRWQLPEKLPVHINLPEYTSTQPAYGSHEGMNDVLFFVSDRPGGQGGLDIWYSVISGKSYAEPVNLGSFVNSPGNEISPFFNSTTQTLFFSSDWIEGFGGFDIFKTKGYYNSWQKPKNLGMPINTSYNDMYYVYNDEFNEAYLTSNRPGSLFLKGETCCNDIFYVKFKDVEKDSIVEELVVSDTVLPDIQTKINELLPLTLYFHNDEPDPATTKTHSEGNYQESLIEYLALKEIYIKEYSSGLTGNEKNQAQSDIVEFFNNYVKGGFEKLERFVKWLEQDLDSGNTVHITIRGYCSPLNTSQYNINLSKRRISSLINFIKTYENGKLLPYINGTANNDGKLIIFEEPLGDREASPFVSNNPHDVRNSIYSRAAALERKVEIIQYNSGQDSSALLFPKISINNPVHDFGDVKKGERKVHIFTFRNSGETSLFLTSVESTSSSIVTDWQVKEIKPGTSGVINVLFDSKNLTGKFREFIYVTGNTNQGKLSLQIKANIID